MMAFDGHQREALYPGHVEVAGRQRSVDADHGLADGLLLKFRHVVFRIALDELCGRVDAWDRESKLDIGGSNRH